MKKDNRFAIAVVISGQLAIELKRIQKQYYLPIWKPSIPLHITLVSPFSTSLTVSELQKRLFVVSKRLKSFKIGINGFGRFDNEQSVFFARVKPNKKLKQLADKIMLAVSDLRSPRSRPFNPHITLAATGSRKEVDEYFKITTGSSPRFSFKCTNFSLLKLNRRVNRWEVTRTFKLS